MSTATAVGTLRVGNAPCSWGTLEFEEAKGEQIGFARMLDELAETGYTGTELGDWGYMPTDPAALRAELEKRKLVMLGAFVPVALKDAAAHEAGISNAVKTAKLLAAVAADPKPYLVLADNNGTVTERTANAGRVTPEMGLSSDEWLAFADGANKVGRAVWDEAGLRTVFHHHCAGYVETPDEIARFLEMTDPDAIGLVFDTATQAAAWGYVASTSKQPAFALAMGLAFTLGMTLPLDNTNSVEEADMWNAFALTVGYLIAAGGPLVVGYLRDVTGDFRSGWWLLVAVSAARARHTRLENRLPADGGGILIAEGRQKRLLECLQYFPGGAIGLKPFRRRICGNAQSDLQQA